MPEDVEQQNFTVTVKDASGNAATAIVNLVPNSAALFDGQIGTIVAGVGDTLRYHFDDDLFAEDDLDLSVTLPPGLEWLRFDSATRDLFGTVPTRAKPTTAKATLTAESRDGGERQSQVFTIDVKAAAVTNPSSSSPTTRTLPTHSSTPTSEAELGSERPSSGPSGGVIAAIVVLS